MADSRSASTATAWRKPSAGFHGHAPRATRLEPHGPNGAERPAHLHDVIALGRTIVVVTLEA
ncbi:hypothetical protein [Burkholderia sp. IMCC1007]|uniref:hypothetical protein n=1 Tax=Burkholderia sp. IMCC1007 TaxID=3004104 RepID=UPI0022B438BD|nr:hypothetical protein [Burkholderia sp. IMCC1007]